MASLNKIPELMQVIDQIPLGLANTSEEFLKSAMPRFYDAIKDAAPEGKEEPEFTLGQRRFSHGRPSRRQGFKPLAEGWIDPEYESIDTSDGSKSTVSFKSESEHLKWVIGRTKRHDEPKIRPGPMVFFWYRRSEGAAFWHVNHPGTEENNFIENLLISRWRKVLGLEFSRANYLKSLRDFFNA